MNRASDIEITQRKKELFKQLKIKHSKRKLIISNIPLDTTLEELQTLFSIALQTLCPSEQVTSVIELSSCRTYAVIEFHDKKSIELCLMLSGMEFRGRRLSVLRHKAFISQRANEIKREVREKEKSDRDTELIMSGNPFPTHENRIFMGNLPTNLPEEDIRRMVESFGKLRSFSLAKTAAVGGDSRGFCFFEYFDAKITDKAIEELNQLDIGDKRVKCQRAVQSRSSTALALPSVQDSRRTRFSEPLFKYGPSGILSSLTALQLQQIQACFSVPVHAKSPSKCVVLVNILRAEDLVDEFEFHDYFNDIWQECQKQGLVESLHIPRPDLDTLEVPLNVGKVYVKYYDIVSAKKARYRLSGRTFNRRTVIVAFYPESWFNSHEFQ